jgi:hypothetical protein
VNQRPVNGGPGGTRSQPRVGAEVEVLFLAARTPGTIVAVDGTGRLVEVLTAEGERLAFTLSPATARFHADSGAKLRFLP